MRGDPATTSSAPRKRRDPGRLLRGHATRRDLVCGERLAAARTAGVKKSKTRLARSTRLPAAGPLGAGPARLCGRLARLLSLLQPPLERAQEAHEQREGRDQDERG